MNKKEAVAYAQIALDYMQSSKYNGEINPETLGMEMKQAFKMYSHSIVETIADSQIKANKRIENIKSERDVNEQRR